MIRTRCGEITPDVVLGIESEARCPTVGFDVPVGGGDLAGEPDDSFDHRGELAEGQFSFEDLTQGGGQVFERLDAENLVAIGIAERDPEPRVGDREGTDRLDPNVTQTIGIDQDEPAPGRRGSARTVGATASNYRKRERFPRGDLAKKKDVEGS